MPYEQGPIQQEKPERTYTPEEEANLRTFRDAFLAGLREAVIRSYQDDNYREANHLNPLDVEKKYIEAAQKIAPEFVYNDDGTVRDIIFKLRHEEGGTTQDFTPERNNAGSAFVNAERASKAGARLFREASIREEMGRNEESRRYAETAAAGITDDPRSKIEWLDKVATYQRKDGGLSRELEQLKEK